MPAPRPLAAALLLLALAAHPCQAAAPVRWILDQGALAKGADAAPPANVTLPQAKGTCASLAGCAGFTFEAGSATPAGIVQVYFKSASTNWNTNTAWWSYSKPVKKVRTCSPQSNVSALPFCDASKSMKERADALVAALTLPEKISTFELTRMLSGIPRLGIVPFRWDATDIEGVDDQVFKYNNTCFPHAIGLGATWDVELIEEVSRITATEARVMEHLYWERSAVLYATSFDGGPLANMAYDPRVGRTSEMYGECPFHVSAIGVAATRALQNKTAPSANGDYYLQTSQVTRHFLTDHSSSPDNRAGDYWGGLDSLEDEFLPAFKAFQMDGEAEGIMFSISALNGMADTANGYLFDKLRKEWGSECLAQTDCCGTFNNAVGVHHNFNTTQEAVTAAIKAGIQLDYGDNTSPDIARALNQSKLSMADLDQAIARAFLVRFRLGEFDDGQRNPFFGRYDAKLLDSQAHRTSARKAVAASAVVLQNIDDVLPLKPGLKKVAVVGPWSDCHDRKGGYGGSVCYLNNYKGQPSYINSILDATKAEAEAKGFEVVYAQGAAPGSTGSHMPPPNATLIAAAVVAVKGADVVLVNLGLGNAVEGESRDRAYLTFPPPQAALLGNITEAVQHTRTKVVLVINSAGGVDFDPSGVDAAVQLWYGGQETGRGLADVLWGRVNPSGRLPLTIHPTAYLSTGIKGVPSLNMSFPSNATARTGVQGRTYRYLASQEKDAIFSFGWGLSYSKFDYANLSASSTKITATVTNVGAVAGAEVAQLYLTLPAATATAAAGAGQGTTRLPPVKHALGGFTKVMLAAGASATVEFSLKPEQLTVVGADGGRATCTGTVARWVWLLPGTFRLTLAQSCRRTPSTQATFCRAASSCHSYCLR